MDLFIFIMLVSGCFVFCYFHKHLLVTLISLEFLVLLLFFMMYNYLLMCGLEMYFIILFLTFSVCEGALGLGILVGMIRSHGNDYISSMSVLSW
nr:NADH dehydrogenase subunit 4L [Artheneis intricata]